MTSRKHTHRRLLLFLVAYWGWWWHGSCTSRSLLWRVHSGHHAQWKSCAPRRGAAGRYEENFCERVSPFQMPTSSFSEMLPQIVFAAADNDHEPADKKRPYRLPMFFEDSQHVTFLLRDWHTEDPAPYALCCLATMLIAFASIMLKGARRELETLLLQRKNNKNHASGTDTVGSTRPADRKIAGSPNNCPAAAADARKGDFLSRGNTMKQNTAGKESGARGESFPAGPNALRAIAAFINYTLDYILMLLAMTFNMGIVLSLLGGIAVGFLLIGHHLLPPPLQKRSQAPSFGSQDSRSAGTKGTALGDGSRSSESSKKHMSTQKSLNTLPQVSGSTGLGTESEAPMEMGAASGEGKHPLGALREARLKNGRSVCIVPYGSQEDMYWCTYTGAIEEEQQGAQRQEEKQKERMCAAGIMGAKGGMDAEARRFDGKGRAAVGAAAVCEESRGGKEITKTNDFTAVDVSGLPTAAVPSEHYAATSADSSSVRGSLELSAPPFHSSGTETPINAAQNGLEHPGQAKKTGTTAASTEAAGSHHSRSGARAGAGEGTQDTRKKEHREGRKSDTESGKTNVRPPLTRPLRVASPNIDEKKNKKDVTLERHLNTPQQAKTVSASARGTEFHRRPSDCYDMLAVAENLKKLYGADFPAPPNQTSH